MSARGTARRLESFPGCVTVNETFPPRRGREAAWRLEPFPSVSAVPGTHVDRREPSAEKVACTGLERGGNQWQSVAISGNQWQLVAISGNQWHAPARASSAAAEVPRRDGRGETSA
jgi:hypothetical protein